MTIVSPIFLNMCLLCLIFSLSACACTEVKLQQLTSQQQQQSVLLAEQAERLTRQEQNLAQIQQNQTQLLASMESISQQIAANNSALNERLETVQANRTANLDGRSLELKKPTKTKVADPEPARESGKLVVGRVEWVWIDALQRKLKARVDTGAALSSLHATKIERFERDSKNWVRFTMRVNAEGEEGVGGIDHVFEAPLARLVRVRQVSTEGAETRPVVRLRVKLGRIEEDCDFTLTNRDSMNYPVLLGRKFLQDIVTVDVALKFTQPLEPRPQP